MKKNKMMRIAAVLLIVTLLSTCAISGTFAKYVAKADMEDSARVAKWGIKIETSGSLFSDKYLADDVDYIAAGGEYSVEAFNGDDVVAPGTTSYVYGTKEIQDPNYPNDPTKKITVKDYRNLQDMGFTAHLYGKPEVATRFKLELGGLQDVFLPFDNGYTDYSEAVKDGVAETFDLIGPSAADIGLNHTYTTGYSPVKWDVTVSRVEDDGTVNEDKTLSLSEIAADVASTQFAGLYDSIFTPEGISITDAKTVVKEVKERGLESMILDKINQQFAGHGFRNLVVDIDEDGIVTLSMDFDPNENCNYLFQGGWTWAFEQSAPSFVGSQSAAYVEMMNKADTYLGNAAAGIVPKVSPSGKEVSTDLKFSFIASATQID